MYKINKFYTRSQALMSTAQNGYKITIELITRLISYLQPLSGACARINRFLHLRNLCMYVCVCVFFLIILRQFIGRFMYRSMSSGVQHTIYIYYQTGLRLSILVCHLFELFYQLCLLNYCCMCLALRYLFEWISLIQNQSCY